MLCGFRKNKTKTKVYSEEEVDELLKEKLTVHKDVVYGWAMADTSDTFEIVCRRQGNVVSIDFDFSNLEHEGLIIFEIPEKYLPNERKKVFHSGYADPLGNSWSFTIGINPLADLPENHRQVGSFNRKIQLTTGTTDEVNYENVSDFHHISYIVD